MLRAETATRRRRKPPGEQARACDSENRAQRRARSVAPSLAASSPPFSVPLMADETPAALRALALEARRASRALQARASRSARARLRSPPSPQALSTEKRCAILLRLADGLLSSEQQILAANAEDVAAAEAACVAPALLARLKLTPAKLAALAGACTTSLCGQALARSLSLPQPGRAQSRAFPSRWAARWRALSWLRGWSSLGWPLLWACCW